MPGEREENGPKKAKPGAWWLVWAPDKAVVLSLHTGQAVFIDWDIKHGQMTAYRWPPANGYAVASRPCP